MDTPTVTVLMAVYNAEAYVSQAVESILTQSFSDFEFLIIDDASNDESFAILQLYAAKDQRIRLLRNSKNLKAAATRNRGLAQARGHYLAPMDADDISFPNRLAVEVAFLDAHPEIGLVSANAYTINSTGKIADVPILLHGYTPAQVAWSLYLIDNPIAHSAVMYRTTLAQACGGYNEASRHGVEDYLLWRQLVSNTRMLVLNKPLLYYREHTASLTGGGGSLVHQEEVARLSRPLLEDQLGHSVSERQISLFRGLPVDPGPTEGEISGCINLVIEIFDAFVRTFDPTPLERQETIPLLTRKLNRLLMTHQKSIAYGRDLRTISRFSPRVAAQVAVHGGIFFVLVGQNNSPHILSSLKKLLTLFRKLKFMIVYRSKNT
jgi:hypothetical protein